MIKDINLEGLIKVHSENPNGLLTCVDELAGYFTRMNKYNKKSILQEWQHHNVDLLKKELLEPLAIAIPKFESYVFRIALVLHLVESFFSGERSPTISAETGCGAIILTNWFMGQYRYILAKNSTKVNQEGKILKIKEFLDKKGYATPSKIKNYHRSFSDTTNDEFKNYFNLLVNSNYAVWRKTNGHGLRIDKRE